MNKFFFSSLLLLAITSCCPDGEVCPELPDPTRVIPTGTSGEPNTCDAPLQVCQVDADCSSDLKCVVTAKGPEEQRRCLLPCDGSCPCPGDICTKVSGDLFCMEQLGG